MAANKSTQTPLTLGAIARWSGITRRFPSKAANQTVKSLNNDSRAIAAGEVFVALSTDKDDGHRYVGAALERGAIAAIVAKSKMHLVSGIDKSKLIAVADPLTTLHRIAARYRASIGIPIVAITGSSGKTTARSFVSTVLKQSLTVGETSGNLNNHIGVPLSVLRFTGSEDVGVIEMGANHAGEINLLSRTVKPTIGVVTNIGYAHVGLFGSLAATTKAKLEIVDGMSARGGFLMLNGDDPLLRRAAETIRQEVVFFGFSKRCHVRARNVTVTGTDGSVFEVDGLKYCLSIPGRHFMYSALIAIHIGRHFCVDYHRMAEALQSMKPVSMRGTVEKKSGAAFIVDCYNANPSSMKNAIRFLQDIAGTGRKTAIVGDMLELGKYAKRLHRELGKQLAQAGVQQIVAVGAFAQCIADGAVAEGMRKSSIHTAPDSAAAAPIAKSLVRKGDVVLLKGSRGVHLETVYEGF